MFLKQLSILNFKNIAESDLEFSGKVNCFLGRNGMGKSNLLDAIYYLSFCKSHTNPIDNQLIRHEEEFFMINGIFERLDIEERITTSVKRRQKKQFKRNTKEYERLADHIGFIPLVMISPADIQLIQGGSEERRRFIDSFISQYDKKYLTALMQYNTALHHRNALLKGDSHDEMMYDLYEEQMHIMATYLFQQRKEFVNQFIPLFQGYFNDITDGAEQVSLRYISSLDDEPFIDQLKRSRQRDIILGYTSKGIHKDDLEMLLGDFQIKRIGSQGQNKSFLVSLKFAQYELLKLKSGLLPLLLLDDIFDKLDADRVLRIMQLVSSHQFGQIFISDTNREQLDKLVTLTQADAYFYQLINGKVSFL